MDTIGAHVTLTGVVETPKESRCAVEIAKNVAGVKSVKNYMQIGGKSFGDMFNYKWIWRNIKSELIAEPELCPLNIDVDVNKGVVTLTGIVGDAYQKL